MPLADPRSLRLRLRCYGAHDAADQDSHAGIELHAAVFSCRRFAVPRHVATGLAPKAVGSHRSDGRHAERMLLGGGVLCVRGGHRPGTGGQSHRQRCCRGSASLQAGGSKGDDPFQPLRTRPLRHGCGYQKYHSGDLSDETGDEKELAMALAGLSSVPETV